MKKTLSTLLIAAMAISFTAPTMVSASETQERGIVSVSTTANTEITPDVVEISIGVETFDSKSMQKATDENKQISDKVHSALASMINKENGDYIKTSNYNASPMYTYNSGKRAFSKYRVSNSIIVHTKSVKDAGKMIDKAISLGATNVNNLTFSISTHDAQCNELLSIAAKKAYTRANLLAGATSSTLAGLKNIDGHCSTSNATPVMYRMMAKNTLAADSASGAVEEASSPVQPGVIKIFANLNASFFVK